MKPKFQELYRNIAREVAKMSHARRRQVGAVIVKDDRVISMGYNGMPAGWENNCEDRIYNTRFEQQADFSWMCPVSYKVVDIEDYYPLVDDEGKRYYLKTKPEVLHAERNALDKLAKGNESGLGSVMFITCAPCLECAKSIFGAGISRVFYSDDYNSEDGIYFLKKCGVVVEKLVFSDK